MDCRSRLAIRTVMPALGWSAGTDVDIRLDGSRVIIHPNVSGVTTLTQQDHLRLPAAIRHQCGLRPSDRVLLVADSGTLVVYPPAALDVLLASVPA